MCGDSMDLIDGKPTGSVRVSFGFSSTLDDARHFLKFVRECFLDVSCVADSMSANVADSVSPSVADTVSANITDDMARSLPEHLSTNVADVDVADATSVADSMSTNVADSMSMSVAPTAAARLMPTMSKDALRLVKIFIYPVKSCAAVQVNQSIFFTCSLYSFFIYILLRLPFSRKILCFWNLKIVT